MKKILIISGTVMGLMLSLPVHSHAQQQAHSMPAKQTNGDLKATRDIKVISSAGARALADACSAWAEQNKKIVAMAILDWGGNLIESHAMEGAAFNAIDTALLKAKSALRWRRATSETNRIVRSGENLAPTFMRDFPQPGALPGRGRRPGDRRDGRVKRGRRKMRPGRHRCGVQERPLARAVRWATLRRDAPERYP